MRSAPLSDADQSIILDKATTLLNMEWLMAHASSPYAAFEEVQHLAAVTGQSPHQVRTCLNNLRARTKIRDDPCAQEDTAVKLLGNADFDALIWHDETSQNNGLTDTLASIVPSDMFQTLESLESNQTTFVTDYADLPSPDETSNVQLPYPSVPDYKKPFKRKGKRQYASRSMHTSGQPFGQTSSEDSGDPSPDVHNFHIIQWTCMPGGYLIEDVSCAFCSELFPENSHFEKHNISKCILKDHRERTFGRKDLLKQHVQQVHLVDVDATQSRAFQVPNAWARDVDTAESDPQSLWCGFCKANFDSTKKRMEHVAGHFRDGANMDQWHSGFLRPAH
ncbi:hypothetical protein CC78DRAFT_590418 [Lojkania enalia]|uniref:C2H2-type domain-containing protein n=1 Tax=Lojkania enalia TaxID=147567 RepID=A0A9P4KFC5_9PLEO|nr:hypothetical protein CC78DRAFT_590418 [Didymosphaeria enalia]